MDKAQFYHQFWSQFGLPAYDETTVPEKGDNKAEMPYITYMVVEDEFGRPVYPSASLWYKGTSWAAISQKSKEIAEFIGLGGYVEKIDGGYVWIQRGHPFAQRVGDDDDTVRRIVINVELEFFTEN